MDDVVFLVDEMLDQFFVAPGHSQAVLGIEKEVKGRETGEILTGRFIDAVGKSRGVDMDLMAELGEFLGENLGGGGNAVDAGEISVGNQGDFQVLSLQN